MECDLHLRFEQSELLKLLMCEWMCDLSFLDLNHTHRGWYFFLWWMLTFALIYETSEMNNLMMWNKKHYLSSELESHVLKKTFLLISQLKTDNCWSEKLCDILNDKYCINSWHSYHITPYHSYSTLVLLLNRWQHCCRCSVASAERKYSLVDMSRMWTQRLDMMTAICARAELK